MKGSDQFRQALEDGDYRQVAAIDKIVNPHLPPITSDADAETTMHIARTSASKVLFRKRAYSHRWLIERGLPSQLPDRLRPRAEQLCPKVVQAVGIACGTGKEWLKPALEIVRGSMEHAVEECFADNEYDPAVVKSRMMEARQRTNKQLFGLISLKGVTNG